MGEVGRTDQFQHCQSADDVIMPIEKDGTLVSLRIAEAQVEKRGCIPVPYDAFPEVFHEIPELLKGKEPIINSA
jgi:hypothetical protein